MPQNSEPHFEIPDPDRPQPETAAIAYHDQGAAFGALAEILARHTDRLMAMEGVVMVAQGQDEVGRDCITVGVRSAQYLDRIPREIEGVPTRATVIGEVIAY